MDIMQDYIQFILVNVWCKAEEGMAYDIAVLFDAKKDLRDMITELHTQELKGADTFLTSLQSLFEKFKLLDDAQKQQFISWFQLNNNIQQLCEQGNVLQPATYEFIANVFPNVQYPNLVIDLKKFYKNLYSNGFLTLDSVKSRIGKVSERYQKFTAKNDKDVCPFCGLVGLLGQYYSKRDAYDHYFPKDKYPFNSINFYNLVPACPRCNSSYKLAKDPLQNPRKVFYPFSVNPYPIELALKINQPDWENLQPNDIELEIGPNVLNSELDTWNDLYGIIERYKAECSSTGAGKAWLTEVFERADKLNMSKRQYVETMELDSKLDPFVDKRFLRKIFLEGCMNARLFD